MTEEKFEQLSNRYKEVVKGFSVDQKKMSYAEMEVWNGHAWALSVLASKIGPITDQYDAYSADSDSETLEGIIEHAEWLKERLKWIKSKQ